MTTLRHTTYRICTALLFCLLQMAGIVLYGQDDPRASLKRAHRLPPADTVAVLQHRVADADTIPLLHRLPAASAADSVATADSIAASNRQTMLEMTSAPDIREEPVPADSLQNAVDVKRWVPNPTKATWLALVIPGGGQIYNRKFWKLPIFYGGFAGCAYALTWNSKMYNDYADAYRDAGLMPVISQDIPHYVLFLQVQHIDKGHSASHETEQCHIGRPFQMTLFPTPPHTGKLFYPTERNRPFRGLFPFQLQSVKRGLISGNHQATPGCCVIDSPQATQVTINRIGAQAHALQVSSEVRYHRRCYLLHPIILSVQELQEMVACCPI